MPMMEYAYQKKIYEIVEKETRGMDSIYEDYICSLVGIHGLNTLIEANLLETCGVINGRPLYVLCELVYGGYKQRG